MGSIPNGKITDENEPFPLTDVDHKIPSQTDEVHHYLNWAELKEIIGITVSSFSIS